MDLKHLAFQHLGRSNVDKRHPFRTCWVSTFGEYPDVRTVIKRRWYEEGRVLIFTDPRTEKVRQLQDNSRSAIVFYHPRIRLQVRMRCEAQLLEEDHKDYARYLEQVRQSPSVSDYTSIPSPGTVKENKVVSHGEVIHFMPIYFNVIEMDVVLLGRDVHKRSRLTKEGRSWMEVPLIP